MKENRKCCPNCGSEILSNQKFCTECGLNLQNFRKNKGLRRFIKVFLMICTPAFILAMIALFAINKEFSVYKDNCNSEQAKNAFIFALKQRYSNTFNKEIYVNTSYTVSSNNFDYLCKANVSTQDGSNVDLQYQYNTKTKEASNLKILIPACDDYNVANDILNAYLKDADFMEENSYYTEEIYKKYRYSNKYGFTKLFELYYNLYLDITKKSLSDIKTIEIKNNKNSCNGNVVLSVKDRSFYKLICPVDYEVKLCEDSFNICYAYNANTFYCREQGRNETAYKKYEETNRPKNITPALNTQENTNYSNNKVKQQNIQKQKEREKIENDLFN